MMFVCDICGRQALTHRGNMIHRSSHDPENQKRRSEAARKSLNRPKTREKLRKSQKEAQNRPEVKARRKVTDLHPETKERRSRAAKKASNRPEVKERQRKSALIAGSRPDVKERRSRAQKEAQNRPETKERHRVAAEKLWRRVDIRERVKETNARPETKERRNRGLKKRWAKPGAKEHQSKIQKEIQKRPGVRKKCHETMKRNGSYRKKTKPEAILEQHLTSLFGEHDVVYQKFVNRWPIDFYIKSTNVYIQMDGMHWHGLDRPLEEIMKCKTRHDESILKKIKIDAEQNQWFQKNQMKLFRICEDDVLSSNYTELDAWLCA